MKLWRPSNSPCVPQTIPELSLKYYKRFVSNPIIHINEHMTAKFGGRELCSRMITEFVSQSIRILEINCGVLYCFDWLINTDDGATRDASRRFHTKLFPRDPSYDLLLKMRSVASRRRASLYRDKYSYNY